jgi:molybdate transport system ATP-binding protein
MVTIKIHKKLHGANGEMDLDVNLEIQKGEFVALAGKSGSGKTTLLRILAGLEEAKGNITIDGEVWLDNQKALAPQKRKIGFVFQDYALFSNMTVEENLLYVNNDRTLAEHLLDLTELSELKKRLPNTLSGGQKQRVSLCRAMMNRPKLLLMDEPLSALDPKMRTKLQNEILQLHREFGTTTIMVSHDPSEIFRLASRVFLLDEGKIIREGTAKEVMMNQHGLQGELLAVGANNIGTLLVGQQLIEVELSQETLNSYEIGDFITLETHKAI